MHRIISSLKRIKTGCWALLLSFIGITAVEFSYVLGGFTWLDFMIFLLFPAFILLIIHLLFNCTPKTKDYYLAFAILVACILYSLFRSRNIEIGSASDNYHNLKIVAFSIKNNFFTQLNYKNTFTEIYISDFIESIWGILWRWTQWDHITIIIQAFPIFLLWQQLVLFFQSQKVTSFPGLLATMVVMSLEILWCQQGSTYIDSIIGIFIGINLILCYKFLSPPYERRFSSLAGLVIISGLCIVSKPTGLSVGLLGLTVAFALGFRHLNTSKRMLLLLTASPSLIYFIYHQTQVYLLKGNFFYPFVNSTNSLQFFNGYYKIPISLRFPSWIANFALHFKPLYVLISWLADYKRESDISPAPTIRGNGLIFTYFVIPTIVLWIIKHKDFLKDKLWKDFRLVVLGVIIIYYCCFEASAEARFALGYNIFILSWCLAYFWNNLEQWGMRWPKISYAFIICLMLLMSLGSYADANRGIYMEPHRISILSIQKEIFPHPYTSDIRTDRIKKLFGP